MNALRFSDGNRGMVKARSFFSGALVAGTIIGGCRRPPETGAKEPMVVNIPQAGRESRPEKSISDIECSGSTATETKIEEGARPCIGLAGENVLDSCAGKADYMGCIAERLADKPVEIGQGHFQFVTPVGGDVFRYTVGEFMQGREIRLTVESVSSEGVTFRALERDCLYFRGEVSSKLLSPRELSEAAGRLQTESHTFLVGYNQEITGDSGWLETHGITNMKVQSAGSGGVRVSFHSPLVKCE